MSNEPQQQKCLSFDLARAIQQQIEALPGRWASSLVSLAEREPNAYRVEIRKAGISGDAACQLHQIAVQRDVELSMSVDDEFPPPQQLRIVFDRPGHWYAEGRQHG